MAVVNPAQYKNAYLPETNSFFQLDSDNVIVSAIKKSENDNSVVVRLYDMVGKESNFNLQVDQKFKIQKAFNTSLIEEELSEQTHSGNKIPIELKPYGIETFKMYLE